MTKSLINKLKGGFRSIKRNLRNIILSATAGLFLYGAQCVPNPPPTPPDPNNNLPEAMLYVSPNYGQAPLPVSIKLDGEDADGIEDISEYRIEIDKGDDGTIEETISQSTPIDITKYFDAGDVKIYGQVIDSHDAMDEKSLSVIVSVPYAPTVDYDDLNSIPERNFNEESQTIINLPSPYDPNPEDEPVWYTDARALEVDGKIKVNVDKSMLGGNKLILTGITDLTGIYQVELELKNIKDEIGKAILQGEIYNLVDIKGELQNTKTHEREKGEVWVTPYSDRNTILKRVLTNPDGTFDFQLDQQLSKFLLRGYILNENNQPKSFVRTILFAGGEEEGFRTILFFGEDKSGIKIIVMPSDTLYGITPLQFKTHYGEVNITPYSPEGNPYVAGNPNPGHKKWNFGNIPDVEEWLEGIEILYIDPITNSSFSIGDQNLIESIIRNNCLRGNQLNIQKDTTPYDPNDPTDIEHYTKHSTYITPHLNWGIVIPDYKLPNGTGGLTTIYDNNANGYFESFKSRIKEKTNSVIAHEIPGHGIYFPGHAILLSNEQSVMNSIDNPQLLGFTDIDREASYIGEEEDYRGMEHHDNILGLDYPSP